MKTIVFLLLTFALQSAYSGEFTYNNLMLDIQIDSKILSKIAKDDAENALGLKVKNAESCINQSFYLAKSNQRIQIKINKILWLDQPSISRLGRHAFAPDRTKDGSTDPGQAGSKTINHIVNYYDVSDNHVPSVFTKPYVALLNDKRFAKIFRLETLQLESEDLTNKFAKNHDPILKNRIESLQAEEDAIQKSFANPSKDLLDVVSQVQQLSVMSNKVRLQLNGFFEPLGANILPHELMHSYGGLVDNYTDPSNTTPNLMGAFNGGNTCILTKQQVEQFKNYRGIKD